MSAVASLPRPPPFTAIPTRPPTPPAHGAYVSFGETRRLDESVATPQDVGAVSLLRQHATTEENVQALLSDTLDKFAALVDALHQGQAPPEDLRDVVVNLMFVVNEHRAHQARQILIDALEAQLRRKREIIQDVDKCIGDFEAELALLMGETETRVDFGHASSVAAVLDRELDLLLSLR